MVHEIMDQLRGRNTPVFPAGLGLGRCVKVFIYWLRLYNFDTMGFGKDNKGQMWREGGIITLGTLAANTAIKAATQIAITEDARLLSMDLGLHMIGLTNLEGPIIMGICNNELTVAEIAEALNMDGPLDRNDRELNENIGKAVFPLALLTAQGFVPMGKWVNAESNAGISANGSSLLGGRRTLQWTFSNPEGWTWFAFNFSGSALTTGAILRFFATYYGVWLQ